MTNSVMTPAEEAELKRLLQMDSADIPGAGAGVNRDLKDPTHTTPRSLFYGVYNNTGNNADKFKFRSALRVGRDKPRWINLGYFNDEIIAAMAYNVAAVNMFGKGAWLNPVDATMVGDTDELARWRKQRGEHIETAKTKIAQLKAEGIEPRYVDLEARSQEADHSPV